MSPVESYGLGLGAQLIQICIQESLCIIPMRSAHAGKSAQTLRPKQKKTIAMSKPASPKPYPRLRLSLLFLVSRERTKGAGVACPQVASKIGNVGGSGWACDSRRMRVRGGLGLDFSHLGFEVQSSRFGVQGSRSALTWKSHSQSTRCWQSMSRKE